MKFKINLTNIFIFCLLFLPLIIWKGYYEGPKIFVFLLIGFFLTIFWLYKSLVKKQFMVFTESDIFYLLWTAVMVISSIFGVHPLESIIGGSYRHQGILFFLTLWLVYKTVQLFNSQQKLFLEKGIGFLVLVESIIVIVQYLFGNVYFGKALGTIGEANAVVGFLAIGSFYVIQYFSIVFIVVPIVPILISFSRSGVLAFLPNLILLFRNFGKKVKAIFGFFAIILSILFLLFISIQKRDSVFENRQTIWKMAVQQISTRPILGFGAESGEAIFNTAFAKANIPLRDLIIDRAHNLFIDVGIWSGLLGLAFFCCYLYFRYREIKDVGKKVVFFSFLIYSMFQPLSIIHWLLFFLM